MIHFASLFSPALDADLAARWAAHYARFGFDSYKIFLHVPHGMTGAARRVMEIFRRQYMAVVCVYEGYFGGGSLRGKIMENYRKSLPAGDYLVTADSDEIQDMGSDYRDIILNHDVTVGRLVEQSAATLRTATDMRPLREQFPFEDAVPDMGRPKDKILASRSDIPVVFNGSHCLAGSPGGLIISAGHAVRHYTWRPGIVERLCARPYIPASYVEQVCAHFGIDVPGIVAEKFLKDRENQAKILESVFG